ncbi:MAG: SpoIIE family protein phosphatase [Spirochaetales bacterium]|nr:SpoIIE family protein phosphatase [Spirochaetales bacterium]
MDIFTYINLGSFFPIIIFTLVLWSDIRNKPQFGKRPRYLLFSLIVFCAIAVFLIQYKILYSFWKPELSFPLFSVIFPFYIFTFFVLEYSIHRQRIIKSHAWEDFKKNLRTTIRYWLIILGIAVCSFFLFYLYTLKLFDGSIASAVYRSETFATLREQGLAGREDLKTLTLILCLAYAVVSFLLLLKYRKKVFELRGGIIRTNNFTFSMSLLVLVLQVGYFLFFDGFVKPLHSEIFFLLTVAYAIRVFMEYFYQRTLNLERTIIQQEQSVLLMNELVSQEASSPLEEDVDTLKSTITEELDRVKRSLPIHEYAISGSMLYSLEGDILKVISPKLINGFCTPILKTQTIKLLKNKKQISDSILKTVYDIRKISSLPLQDLTDWGEQIIKQILESKEPIVINQIPEELKGLQRLIAVNPIFDKEKLIGLFIVFKDSFDKLFPEEENTINWLIGNLKIILSIITGKRIQRERNRLSNEMNIAKNIQTSILPKDVEIPGYEVATNMVTATEVGGDVYDYFCTTLGNYIGIGDVSGHGLPAGIMSLIQLVAFEAVVMTVDNLSRQIKPYVLYDIVNKLLCKINRDRIGSDKFMTQNYFIEKNGTFTYAGAHEIALLYRKQQDNVIELKDLSRKAAFMGITEKATAKASAGNFKMRKHDVLLLYTDGAIQAKDNYGNQFGIAKLKKILKSNSGMDLNKLIDKIMKQIYNHALNGDLKKYCGNYADDVSLFMIRKK